MLDGVDISGPVNLPPPCLWRRCPVLHHDRIVSALIIQFVHWRIMCWTSIAQAEFRQCAARPAKDGIALGGRGSPLGHCHGCLLSCTQPGKLDSERPTSSRPMGLKACMGLKAAIYFRCGFRNVPEREI